MTLGFKRPKKGTVWVRAALRGREDDSGPLEPGGHYVTLELMDFALAGSRRLASRFHPILVSDLSVTSPLQTQVRASALIDPRQVTESIVSSNGDRNGQAVRTLCVQLPWSGKFSSGEIAVVSLRSEKLLKQLLGSYSALQGKLEDAFGGGEEASAPVEEDDEGHESVTAFLAAKVAGTVLKKVGVAAAVEAAKILTAEDGTYTTRLSVPLPEVKISPGYYVMLQGGGRTPVEVALDYSVLDQPLPTLFVNGKPAKGQDYAVIRVSASPRHENIASVPGVGEAWATLRSVVSSGGNPKAAYSAFIGALTFSPDLFEKDKVQLKNMVDGLLAPLLHTQSVDGQESVAGAALPLIRKAMGSLAKAWAAGTFDLPAAAPPSAAPKPDAPAPPVSQPAPQPSPSNVAQRADTANQRFETALNFCYKWEGDYSDDPVDRGGKTKYGVTEKVFHAWLEGQGEDERPVSSLTKDEARAIYWTNYWRVVRCDALKRQLDLVLFDASVNHGTGGAGIILQRTLNSLRTAAGGTAGAELKTDGAIGAKTLEEVARYDTRVICAEYLEERRRAYERIIEKRPEQKKFRNGWMNRVRDLELAISEGGVHDDYESVTTIPGENTPFAGYED